MRDHENHENDYPYKGERFAGKWLNGPRLGTEGADPEFSKGPVLYDLASDEAETTNLARRPEHAARLRSMLGRLLELAEEQVYPMTMARPPPRDLDPREQSLLLGAKKLTFIY